MEAGMSIVPVLNHNPVRRASVCIHPCSAANAERTGIMETMWRRKLSKAAARDTVAPAEKEEGKPMQNGHTV